MITMSAREEGRLRVLEQVQHGKLSQAQAAGILAVSVRQMRRLQRRYEAQGGAGLVHQLRGHPGRYELVAALGSGLMLSQAMENALAVDADLDLSENLREMIHTASMLTNACTEAQLSAQSCSYGHLFVP